MAEVRLIKGTLHLHSETGTEGGWWSIQDENLIFPPTEAWPHEHWSYDGLHYLETGDYLKIYAPDDSIYWEGEVSFTYHPAFTQDAFGIWIHADQNGIDRKFWATPFFKKYRGELTKKASANP